MHGNDRQKNFSFSARDQAVQFSLLCLSVRFKLELIIPTLQFAEYMYYCISMKYAKPFCLALWMRDSINVAKHTALKFVEETKGEANVRLKTSKSLRKRDAPCFV